VCWWSVKFNHIYVGEKVRCIFPSCYGKTTHSNNKTPLNYPCDHNVTWITSRQREVYLISLLNGNTNLCNVKNSHTNISVSYRQKNKNTAAWAWKTLFLLKGEKKVVLRDKRKQKFNPRSNNVSGEGLYINMSSSIFEKHCFSLSGETRFSLCEEYHVLLFPLLNFPFRNKRILLYDTIQNSAILWDNNQRILTRPYL